MSELERIYQNEYPDFINPYLKSKSMQRLKGVDMNCGLRFTSHAGFSSYGSYTRFDLLQLLRLERYREKDFCRF